MVFGRFIEETMLPLFDFAILKNYDVVFNLSRNLVVNKFINEIAPKNNYLKLNKFTHLKINIVICQ